MLEDGHSDRDQFGSGSGLRAGHYIPEISTCGPAAPATWTYLPPPQISTEIRTQIRN